MKKFLFQEYKDSLSKFLFEQEEEADDAAEDEEAEEAEEESPEEGAEDTKETEEESTEDVSNPADDEGVSLDDDIEAVLIDFEALARKKSSEEISENLRMIYEVADEIDIESFAADVARLIKNYDNLLDIKGMLVDKSKDFIQKKYGDGVADSLISTLETVHDIDLEGSQSETIKSDLEVPLAIGATTAGE